MPNYRRVWVPGGTYFFTVNLLDRTGSLLVENVGALRSAFLETRRVRPFEFVAIVVLPEHLHCIWRLPSGDADNAARWRQIKARFSSTLPDIEQRSASRVHRGERGVWQRRHWERLLRDDGDLQSHVDYVHFNPVKHGHVPHARDWPHSSFHRYVREGILPPDWSDKP